MRGRCFKPTVTECLVFRLDFQNSSFLAVMDFLVSLDIIGLEF